MQNNLPAICFTSSFLSNSVRIGLADRDGGILVSPCDGSASTRDTRMRKKEKDREEDEIERGRERRSRSGRPLRRRNSKAGTYASFIKEIASKDCCFAHGYVSWRCLAPFSHGRWLLRSRHHYCAGAAAAGIRITARLYSICF